MTWHSGGCHVAAAHGNRVSPANEDEMAISKDTNGERGARRTQGSRIWRRGSKGGRRREEEAAAAVKGGTRVPTELRRGGKEHGVEHGRSKPLEEMVSPERL